MSPDPRIGFFAGARDLAEKLAMSLLPPEKAAIAPQLIFNLRVDGWLTLFFALLLWIIVLDMAYTVGRVALGRPVSPLRESDPRRPMNFPDGEQA